uniref:DUF2959 domain-containing protein n=1 Tax=Thaumasiovibrio occultus TaxID=1891184 RepID=UPI000B357CC5|nr:DUF2959 domain-containing protein [Thaumasiovibrio occultus]
MRLTALLLLLSTLLLGCSSAYYDAMEKVGIHKRDILVDRVEDANQAQIDAQAEFSDALSALQAFTGYQGGDLEQMYKRINQQYEDSQAAADEVTKRIDAIEDVADALFQEWYNELALYNDASLRRSSEATLKQTEREYQTMIRAMRTAEASMSPILLTLLDNTLYLKHNLNAAAIGSLDREFADLERDISAAIAEMNRAIAESEAFIRRLQ